MAWNSCWENIPLIHHQLLIHSETGYKDLLHIQDCRRNSSGLHHSTLFNPGCTGAHLLCSACEYCICLFKFPISRLILQNMSVSLSPGDSFSWLLYKILVLIFFCVPLSFSRIHCEREIVIVAYMNAHGLCGKAGSDLCRNFHAESPGISPHNEEKKTNRKKIYWKRRLKPIQATVTYTVSVMASIARISW